MPDSAILIKAPSELIADFNKRIAEACSNVVVADAQVDIMSTMIKGERGTMERAFVPIVTLVATDEEPEIVDGEPQEEEGLMVKLVSVSVTDDNACLKSEERLTKALDEADGLVHDIKIAKEADRAYFLISYFSPEEGEETSDATSRQDA